MGYGATFGILGGGHGPLAPPPPKSAYGFEMSRSTSDHFGGRNHGRNDMTEVPTRAEIPEKQYLLRSSVVTRVG